MMSRMADKVLGAFGGCAALIRPTIAEPEKRNPDNKHPFIWDFFISRDLSVLGGSFKG